MMKEMELPSPPSAVVDDYPSTAKPTQKGQPDNGEALPTATALSYGSPDFRDVQTREKQGERCCGCLCDMRRAVIAVDAVSIVFAIMEICAMIAFLVFYDDIHNEIEGTDDDGWYSMQHNLSKGLVGAGIGFGVLSVIIFSIGIRGASKFHAGMVATAMVYHGLSVFFSLISLNIFGVVLSSLFVYPHIMLFREIRSGIMTAENYVNERRTCCA